MELILSRQKRSSKGMFFTLDSLLATILLFTGIVVIFLASNQTPSELEQKMFLTQDALSAFSKLTLKELNNSFIQQEIANGNITNEDNTILEQLGEYWAKNQSLKAKELFESTGITVLLEDKGIRLSIDEEEIYFKNSSSIKTKIAVNRMVSGVIKDAPLTGYSSSAYLKKIRDKKTSSYAYFGGFIGQGNITHVLMLPEDFVPERTIRAVLKIETPGNFALYFNGIYCGAFAGGASTVREFDITFCNSSLSAGTNNFTLKYSSPLNQSYVSGGFLRVTYRTDVLLDEVSLSAGQKSYFFPSVEGVINLYDSFAVQGIITSWTVNMTYDSIYDTFLMLGNETVFIARGKNTTHNILLTESNLTLPYQTVPLRFALTNLTNITLVQDGLPADAFLITDVSGSMDDCAQYMNQTQCRYEYKQQWWWPFWLTTSCAYNNVSCSGNACSISPIYSTRNHALINQSVCSKTMLDLAKTADDLFVDIVLNNTPHQIGLVDFSTNANTPTNLTNVAAVLHSEISSYASSGGTCTCCGINRARNLLNSSNNKKFLVVLSDGDPTYYCSSYSDYTGEGTGGSSDAIDQEWAINASKIACQQNITVYSIGFGSSMSAQGQDVMRQIACNNSLYYNVANVSLLADIYRNISSQITMSANYSSQTLTVSGNVSAGKIYSGSRIDLTYTDVSTTDLVNKISFNVETEQFLNCSANVFIPSGVEVQDAYVSSYSGNHWTDSVSVNGNSVFNLSIYNMSYSLLGDPFIIQIPAVLLLSGQNNSISIHVADSSFNTTGCSLNNTLIYTALVTVSTPRTDVASVAEGCTWTVAFEDGDIENVVVPSGYSGAKTCSYVPGNITYDLEDTYDVATYNLLNQLDTENSGRVLVNINNLDLEIITTVIGGIPYLWGPSLVTLEVWE